MLASSTKAMIKPMTAPVIMKGKNFGERRMVTCSVFKVVFAMAQLNTIF
jgi:hypothetical protein